MPTDATTDQSTASHTPARRTLMKALGLGGLTTTLGIGSATASGDGDDDDEDDGITTVDPDDTDECESCGKTSHCAMANEVAVTANVETKGTVKFDITVTGKLELPDGRRVQRCKGELDPKHSYNIAFPYSGEIKCLSVRGPGEVVIDQDRPCPGARGGK